MSKLLVGSATDVGLVRSNNQDQLLVAPGLYAVADGMGGHAAGEVASATAVKALRAAFEASDQRSADALLNAARAANRAVWEQAQSHRAMHGMGTTLVALAVVERQDGTNGLAVAHIGDSRLYLLREGSFLQLTVDHSLVQELVDDGQISQAQAAVHPQRHVLTRALGVEPSVDVDLLAVEPHHGDRYLLCSDGLPREAPDDEIAAVLLSFPDPSEAAKQLVGLANSRGGSDNVTVVVVDVRANGQAPDTLITLSQPVPVDTNGRPEGFGSSRPLGASAAVTTITLPSKGPAGVAPDEVPAAAELPPQPGSQLPATARPARRPFALFTWRVGGFVAAVCFVIGGVIGALAWYGRSAYFVGLSGREITIFQGRPGGVLWFEPTVAERTRYNSSSVLPSVLVKLRAGYLEPSVPRARQFISNQVAEKIEAQGETPASARGAPRSAKHVSTPKSSPLTGAKAHQPSAHGTTETSPSTTVPAKKAPPSVQPKRHLSTKLGTATK
jgi:protein phosphatase